MAVVVLAVVFTQFLQLRPSAAQVDAPEPEAAPTRVVVKRFVPFVITDGGEIRGFSIDLLKEIATRVGFDYEMREVATVQAQLDAVRSGEADLAVAGISITSERETTVDFSHPIYNSGLQILINGTEKVSTTEKFMGVLLSTGLRNLVGLLLAVIFVVAHVVWLVERRRNPDFPRGYVRGVWEGCWWAAVTMATVGYGDKPPKTIVGRVLAIFWMFAAILIVANLTASISSSLTVQELRGSINGPSDLFGKRVATVEGTTSSRYLSTVQLTAVGVPTIDEAYVLLEDHKVDAVVYDSPVLRNYAALAGRGKVRVVGPIFQREDYGIAMPIDSPYRQEINQSLLKMIEDGTYRQIYQRWFGNTEQ